MTLRSSNSAFARRVFVAQQAEMIVHFHPLEINVVVCGKKKEKKKKEETRSALKKPRLTFEEWDSSSLSGTDSSGW